MRWTRRSGWLAVWMAAWAWGAVGTPAFGQSIKEQLTALTEGLNDPDPIIRLATYEEAVGSDSATLRRVALRTALQSDDADLRSLALRGALKGRELIAFKLFPTAEHAAALAAAKDDAALKEVQEWYKANDRLLWSYGEVLTVRIASYDYGTGAVDGFCMTGSASPQKAWNASGTVAGDELTLTTRCAVPGPRECTLVAELDKAGKLQGSLRCAGGTGVGQARAELDLL